MTHHIDRRHVWATAVGLALLAALLFAVVLPRIASGAGLIFFVDPVGSDANTGGAGDPFLTIQAGINAAGDDDTVQVNAGVYSEDLHLALKTGLTLRSTDGKGLTTIQLVDGVGINVEGTADGFTLGGAFDESFTILSSASTTFMVQLANAPTDVTVSHNTLDMTKGGTLTEGSGGAGTPSPLELGDHQA